MSMDVMSSTAVGQATSVNKAQTGLDVLTRTVAKAEQLEKPVDAAQRTEIALQTGKGQNIDIMA